MSRALLVDGVGDTINNVEVKLDREQNSLHPRDENNLGVIPDHERYIDLTTTSADHLLDILETPSQTLTSPKSCANSESHTLNLSLETASQTDSFYGVLNNRNIDRVLFGKYEFDTWYGNAAYFNSQDFEHNYLGYELSNKLVSDPTIKLRKKHGLPKNAFWLDKLYVCEYCFKYATQQSQIEQHLINCIFNESLPHQGKLLYRDDESPYIIRQYRGFKHLLFCQNLSLFGKLFLDDKSVYYNVECFDFYVVYGYEEEDPSVMINEEKNPEPDHTNGKDIDTTLKKSKPIVISTPKTRSKTSNSGISKKPIPGIRSKLSKSSKEPYNAIFTKKFKPMGFFSKEILSYDNDNNLACICIFPPFQRRGLGSLLIEFSYELAKYTPGQLKSGPEFPLSPYGKLSYLKFWSKRLANVIYIHLSNSRNFTLEDLSNITGYRKEDILLTLEHMRLLQSNKNGKVKLLLGNLKVWCTENNVDPTKQKTSLKKESLLL